MSQTFQITWVGDRTRDWETDKGQFREYKVALAGYDPSENDPEAGKTVEWSRRRDAQAPAPGDEVFGHIEIKHYDWGNKYVFKTDQAEQGRPPSFKKASNGTGAEYRDNREDRISYQGLLQACIIRGDEDPTVAAKKYFDLVRNFTPTAPKAQQAVGASSDRAESKPAYSGPGPEGVGEPKPAAYEDVTPRKAAVADDDSIPF
jgi:hypothetical protein